MPLLIHVAHKNHVSASASTGRVGGRFGGQAIAGALMQIEGVFFVTGDLLTN